MRAEARRRGRSRVRLLRRVAFFVTAISLALAAYTMLASTSLEFSNVATSSTVDCGSPAYPRSLGDLGSTDDAANCAGQTSAAVALYFVLLAGLSLSVIALTSRATTIDQSEPGTSLHQAGSVSS